MFNFKDKKILIIAPHPDDEVFGCGGLISRAKREGAKVYVLYITVGTTKDFSKKGVSTEKERVKEIATVAKFLKLDGYRLAFPGNDYHLQLDAVPQKKLIHEIEQGKDISLESLKPTIVITCSNHDYNQDHRAVSQSVMTATRPAPAEYKSLQKLVLTHEYAYTAWTDRESQPVPTFTVELSKKDLATKLKALSLYKSQLKHPHGPLSIHAVKTLAYLRGIQAGTNIAEAFFIKRFLT